VTTSLIFGTSLAFAYVDDILSLSFFCSASGWSRRALGLFLRALRGVEPADVPKLYAFFRTHGSEKGDKLRGVWIAEDVGDAAPKQTKIDEATLTADQDDFYGAFSLTKPTKGWPVGKYRVDIYAGDEVAISVKFTIKNGKTEKESEEESADE